MPWKQKGKAGGKGGVVRLLVRSECKFKFVGGRFYGFWVSGRHERRESELQLT